MTLQNRHGCEARTRISCHAALERTACAPFHEERRMQLIEATKFYRKSGGGPVAKREPSPEGLGLNSEYDVSAVGAALNLDSWAEERDANLDSRPPGFGCGRERKYPGR